MSIDRGSLLGRLSDVFRELSLPQERIDLVVNAAIQTILQGQNDLQWPAEKWKKSSEFLSRKQFTIEKFLRRIWKPFIDENNIIVTRQILANKDPGAALALKNYLRSNELPADIRIFTNEQLTEYLSARPMIIKPAKELIL